MQCIVVGYLIVFRAKILRIIYILYECYHNTLKSYTSKFLNKKLCANNSEVLTIKMDNSLKISLFIFNFYRKICLYDKDLFSSK